MSQIFSCNDNCQRHFVLEVNTLTTVDIHRDPACVSVGVVCVGVFVLNILISAALQIVPL